jgi:(E)-4-hydroxy-3-methylbut-2-enyl-diphosphate synthase
MAVTINGTETEEQVRALATIDAICALVNIAAGTSRVHASRRVFQIIKSNNIETPVIHHRVFEGSPVHDEIAILTGSEIGGLLVDGLGDGVVIEVPSADVHALRTTSFGLLQVCNQQSHHQACLHAHHLVEMVSLYSLTLRWTALVTFSSPPTALWRPCDKNK